MAADSMPNRPVVGAVSRGSHRVRAVLRAVGRQPVVAAVIALVRDTVGVCLRYRVTGLAAEAGFFALLSLPPLVLGLAATAAWIGREIGISEGLELRNSIRDLTEPFLTEDIVNSVVVPTLDSAFADTRVDLISLGFLLSLWSGSRALNVYVDTISIMYGLGGKRGIVRTRVLSFSLYLLTLAMGAVTLPLVLIGPSLLGTWLPEAVGWLLVLYWPVVTLLGIALLATLYHISTPVRTSWFRDLPGAFLALVIWVAASFVLRAVIGAAVGGTSIYGPLATPIVVLIWLYLLAIAVLIGAGLNAAVDYQWPDRRRSRARAALAADRDASRADTDGEGIPTGGSRRGGTTGTADDDGGQRQGGRAGSGQQVADTPAPPKPVSARDRGKTG